MNTDFTAFDTHYQLYRYPESGPKELQAWDAADKYLLDQLSPADLSGDQPVIIFNDSFGALALALHQLPVTCVSDSHLARLALENNLRRNQLSPLVHQDCLAELPDAPQLVLIKIPKTLSLLEHQLSMLAKVVTPQTRIIAGGKARDIHNSTLKLFERYLGETRTSLARKKARLIFSEFAAGQSRENPYPTVWPLENTDYRIINHANVFSRDSLDIGARFMLDHLPIAPQARKVLDLGCGNGVLGLMLLHHNPAIELTLVDESYMALASARETITANLGQRAQQCRFVADNCLESFAGESIDEIYCNPPFHQQQAVTGHIATQMFRDALRCLKPGGELVVIGNRHLGYHAQLKRLFGNCQLVDSNQKFVILKACKRARGRQGNGRRTGSV